MTAAVTYARGQSVVEYGPRWEDCFPSPRGQALIIDYGVSFSSCRDSPVRCKRLPSLDEHRGGRPCGGPRPPSSTRQLVGGSALGIARPTSRPPGFHRGDDRRRRRQPGSARRPPQPCGRSTHGRASAPAAPQQPPRRRRPRRAPSPPGRRCPTAPSAPIALREVRHGELAMPPTPPGTYWRIVRSCRSRVLPGRARSPAARSRAGRSPAAGRTPARRSRPRARGLPAARATRPPLQTRRGTAAMARTVERLGDRQHRRAVHAHVAESRAGRRRSESVIQPPVRRPHRVQGHVDVRGERASPSAPLIWPTVVRFTRPVDGAAERQAAADHQQPGPHRRRHPARPGAWPAARDAQPRDRPRRRPRCARAAVCHRHGIGQQPSAQSSTAVRARRARPRRSPSGSLDRMPSSRGGVPGAAGPVAARLEHQQLADPCGDRRRRHAAGPRGAGQQDQPMPAATAVVVLRRRDRRRRRCRTRRAAPHRAGGSRRHGGREQRDSALTGPRRFRSRAAQERAHARRAEGEQERLRESRPARERRHRGRRRVESGAVQRRAVQPARQGTCRGAPVRVPPAGQPARRGSAITSVVSPGAPWPPTTALDSVSTRAVAAASAASSSSRAACRLRRACVGRPHLLRDRQQRRAAR